MENISGQLAEGFALIESRDIRVSSLKINKAHMSSLNKVRPYPYHNSLWGAHIIIDSTLKNPVVVGGDGSRAVWVNNKWSLRGLSQNEKQAAMEEKERDMRYRLRCKQEKKEAEKLDGFKKQLKALFVKDKEKLIRLIVDSIANVSIPRG